MEEKPRFSLAEHDPEVGEGMVRPIVSHVSPPFIWLIKRLWSRVSVVPAPIRSMNSLDDDIGFAQQTNCKEIEV